MKVHNLSIDSSQRDLTIYPNSNNYVITLENPIYHVEEIHLVSARIPTPQTPSPNSLILRLSSGSDEFNQTVYVGTPHYTGHILLNGSTTLTFSSADDPFIHRFHSGPQKIIKDLGIEFLYLDNGVLTPYRFENKDHILKFEMTCSTDKLKNLPKVPLKDLESKNETAISIPKKEEDPYKWKIYIGIVVVFGLILISLMSTKSKRTYLETA
jgi:hypothetical protein